MKRLVIGLVLLTACGGGEPARDPRWQFLAVGVRPAAEADRVQQTLEGGGWSLVSRVEGRTFVAQTFANDETGESSARVVTRRGIVLALDVPPSESAQPIRLLEPPGGDEDIDGDGNEEIVLARHDPAHDRTCLGVVRVIAEGGFLRPVPEDLSDLGDVVCLEDLEDLDDDGVLEGIAVVRLPELAREQVPAVRVPVALRDGRWVPTRAPAGFWERQRARLEEAAAEARSARDVERAYVVAVERAALERAAGASVREQVVAFDRVLSGLVLTPGQARSIRAARAQVAGGWHAD